MRREKNKIMYVSRLYGHLIVAAPGGWNEHLLKCTEMNRVFHKDLNERYRNGHCPLARSVTFILVTLISIKTYRRRPGRQEGALSLPGTQPFETSWLWPWLSLYEASAHLSPADPLANHLSSSLGRRLPCSQVKLSAPLPCVRVLGSGSPVAWISSSVCGLLETFQTCSTAES